MIDHDQHSHTVVQTLRSGGFLNGPLDGSSFFLQTPADQDLHDLRVTLPIGDGMRDVYLFDPQPNPASLEAGLRYVGRQRA